MERLRHLGALLGPPPSFCDEGTTAGPPCLPWRSAPPPDNSWKPTTYTSHDGVASPLGSSQDVSESGAPSGPTNGGSMLPAFHVPTKTRKGVYSGRLGIGSRPFINFSMSSFHAYNCWSDGKPNCHTVPGGALEPRFVPDGSRPCSPVAAAFVVCDRPPAPPPRTQVPLDVVPPLEARDPRRAPPNISEKACTAPPVVASE
mmetsp:Transcript_18284/g.47018  ORF Transcript_18284/g.47018 Transcript_18284/m.47018 type:complete len:201 (-) Transcript_18284:96-698(-)